MLDRLQIQTHSATGLQAAPGKKVLRMVTNDRMAGSIPKWEDPSSPAQDIVANLGSVQTAPAGSSALRTGHAYQDTPSAEGSKSNQAEFGFSDLLDMINPLQHVPVVSHLYRKLTGDEIRPISKIIGGGIFGGGIGAASGLVNVIVESETGQDVTGNALSLMRSGKIARHKSIGEAPEVRLTAAMNDADDYSLPGNLLAFADLRSDPRIVIERVKKD